MRAEVQRRLRLAEITIERRPAEMRAGWWIVELAGVDRNDREYYAAVARRLSEERKKKASRSKGAGLPSRPVKGRIERGEL